jgi:hypothetical protein
MWKEVEWRIEERKVGISYRSSESDVTATSRPAVDLPHRPILATATVCILQTSLNTVNISNPLDTQSRTSDLCSTTTTYFDDEMGLFLENLASIPRGAAPQAKRKG